MKLTATDIIRKPRFFIFEDVRGGQTFVACGKLWVKIGSEKALALNDQSIGQRKFDSSDPVEIPDRIEVVL